MLVTMDTSEALDDDGASTEMPGFESGMLTTAALTVILVTEHNPGSVVCLTMRKQMKKILKFTDHKSTHLRQCIFLWNNIREK